MPKSNLNKLIEIISQKLDIVMQRADHRTPTLNDIYDTFNELGLRIERTNEHSQHIIKLLKYLSNRQINTQTMITQIIPLLKS